MSRERKRIAGAEKLAILKRYLVEKVPISDLCDKHGLQPSQIYNWQAQLFEHGANVFEGKAGRKAHAETAKDRTISHLQLKLAQKNEVISELMEANVREKKRNGSSKGKLGSPRHARPDCGLRQALDGTRGTSG